MDRVFVWTSLLAARTLSFAGTRLLQTLLYGVTRLDPGIYGFASLSLLSAAVLACVGPVLRALRVQPVEVLRSE